MPPYGVRFSQDKQGIEASPPTVSGVPSAMFAQTQGSPRQRELARQRLRDCKSLEFAEQKKVTLSIPSSDSIVLLFLLSKKAQKKKKQKENAVKEMRRGGFLKKAPS